MGAQFSRLKVWVKEKLKVADLNGEFNNILTNLTPAGIDDASVNVAAMQAMANPFPGEVLSLPTSTEGELRRLRFMLAAITGNAYWYEAPGKTIQELNGALPIIPVSLNAVSFALSKQDHGKTIYATSDTAIDCTLLAASAVPSGWWLDIINIGAGAVTLVGEVEGVTGRVLAQWGRLRLMSNGTVWTGRMPTKADVGLGNVDNTADANKTVSHAATCGRAASVADGSITQAKLEPVIAGTDILFATAPTLRSTQSTTYAKLKELQPMKRGGVVTITAAIGSNHYSIIGSFRVYINGSHVGATYSYDGSAGQWWGLSGNFAVAAGDVITIWGQISNGTFTASVKDVLVTGSLPMAGEVL